MNRDTLKTLCWQQNLVQYRCHKTTRYACVCECELEATHMERIKKLQHCNTRKCYHYKVDKGRNIALSWAKGAQRVRHGVPESHDEVVSRVVVLFWYIKSLQNQKSVESQSWYYS